MSTKKLRISPDLSLPLEFVTSTQAILAQKGKGKSYTASVQAEELLEAGQQIVVVDPTGAWWGLRSSADGKSAGYPITILGGEHGDVPLEPTAGEVIADAIATEHFSAVIDLTLFRKAEAMRFMAVFLETLYRKNREALHLFIDEADTVAPQKTFGPEQARVLGAAEDIVRRGRIRGIGCTLITQRPQVLNKDVLTQADMLTTLGMSHPKDLGAIEAWVAVHGDPKQAEKMISSLPSLPLGQAWVWAPASGLFQAVQIRERTTFDSGATPKAGKRVAAPKVLAKVDIARLGETIAATVERARQSDPKALKARVAELEKQLAKKPSGKVEVRKELVPIVTPKHLESIERLLDKAGKVSEIARDISDQLVHGVRDLHHALQAAAAVIDRDVEPPLRAIPPKIQTLPVTNEDVAAIRRVSLGGGGGRFPITPAVNPGATLVLGKGLTIVRPDSLPIGETATLRALIQYPDGLRREQLTVLTGYKRSTRDAYIARLRDRGFVSQGEDGRIQATTAGRAALPSAEPLPTGFELQRWWLKRLPEGERKVLEVLINHYPNHTRRDVIDEATGFKRSTRDAYLSRLAAKELVVHDRGLVMASDTLFEGVA